MKLTRIFHITGTVASVLILLPFVLEQVAPGRFPHWFWTVLTVLVLAFWIATVVMFLVLQVQKWKKWQAGRKKK